MRRLALVLVLALPRMAFAASAQATTPPALRLVARTSRVDYYAVKKRNVDVKRTEEFLDRLQSLFGPAPAGWRIQYYRHPSVRELSDQVGFAALGVADLRTGRIDSSRGFHPHELVHAVMGREGSPPVFFAEGLAVALTSRGLWDGRDIDAVAASEMARKKTLEPFLTAFTDQDPEVSYAVAGSFTAYLLDRQGIAPMLAFVRGCGRSPEAFEAAFRRAYGRSVARLSIEWTAWLGENAARARRAWYEPKQWPGALRREGVSPMEAVASLAGSEPPSPDMNRSDVAAEPESRGAWEGGAN